MVRSMTGYGRSVINEQSTDIIVEVRTVNHRFLDVSAKIPRSLLYIEDQIKKTVQQSFSRGRVDVYVTIDGDGYTDRELVVDWDVLGQLVEKIHAAKREYNLSGTLDVNTIASQSSIFEIMEKEQGIGELDEHIIYALQEACNQALTMRNSEGEALRKDVENRLEFISDLLERLENHRYLVLEQSRKRILERIQEYFQEDTREDSRIYQEVALLAEKGDISEEITRLASHVKQFQIRLEGEEAIGRQLDFIVQEMHREANTIGSKSTDGSTGEWVVQLKSELEKIKEQVQNVE